MRKTIILLAFSILLFFTSNAQFKIGVIAGADYSKINVRQEYQNDFGIQAIPGFHVGLASRLETKGNLSFTADLLFARKGLTQTQQMIGYGWEPNASKSEITFELNYLELPLLAEFKSGFNNWNVHFGVGPYLAYGLDGKINADIRSMTSELHYEEDVRWAKYDIGQSLNPGERLVYESGYSRIKRLDYGPVVRLGVEINSFCIDAEYKYGLANMMWEYREHERFNNQTLGISFKYLLKLNKPATTVNEAN